MLRDEKRVSTVSDKLFKLNHPSAAAVQSVSSLKYIKHVDKYQRSQSLSYSLLEFKTPSSSSLEINAENSPRYLGYFPAAIFATILEDVLIKLRILVEADTQIRINNFIVDKEEYHAAKFGVEQPPEKDELAYVNAKNIHRDEFKLYKLDQDRALFSEVLSSTYRELSLRANFTGLRQHIRRFEEDKNTFDFLKEEEVINRSTVRVLRKQLRQQRNMHKTLMYDSMVIQDTLEKKIEDESTTTETQARFVGNYESARMSQHLTKIRQKEDSHEDAISLFKDNTEQEQRVHAEVETYLTIVTRDIMDQLEYWMRKYEIDIEKMDLKIQIKRNEYMSLLEKRLEIEEIMREHEKEIQAWIEFKEKRRLDQEYRENMVKSAIVVQAWWRGLLVRKKLGPYRPQPLRKRKTSMAKKKTQKTRLRQIKA